MARPGWNTAARVTGQAGSVARGLRSERSHLNHLPDSEHPVDHPAERATKRGRRPGDRYVRIVRSSELPTAAPRHRYLVAPQSTPTSGTGRALLRARTFLFGPPLSTEQEIHERLTKIKALAILSSDALSSVAYATEEMMRVLILAGVAALSLTLPLSLAVLVVLVTVVTSYQQTIQGYPHGGGSYTVASENLGEIPGLTAAAALLTDYVLTVAVSVAAGVLAVTSAFPGLYPYRVELDLAAIVLMVVGNLRGIREAGTIFAAPTYIFIVSIIGLIGYGLFRYLAGTLPTFVAPASWTVQFHGVEALTIILVLRGFSSGLTALTGTEAISNGVPAFKPPESLNARITLIWMGSLLGIMFLGVSFLARHMSIVPDPSEQATVLSVLTRLLVGQGWYFYLVQFATMVILILAANTSFADFPRLASILARDRFLPHQFAFRGDRLAFNTGILALAVLAGILEIAFLGSVNALIPLYAVGVFTAFTLSQSGMVVHWRRLRNRGWQRRAFINGAGAIMTGVATIIIAASKFLAGAWIVLLVIPFIIWQLRKIHRHYDQVSDQLRLPEDTLHHRAVATPHQTTVVVPIAGLNRASLTAIEYAEGISANVMVVHVVGSASEGEELRREWNEAGFQMPLVLIESPYRQLVGPLIDFVEQQHVETGQIVTVVLPEFVPAHLYEVPLHNQTAWRLRTALWTHPGVVTVSVPHHLTV